MAKRTTITIETNSLLIVRARTARRAWCPECGAVAEMVTSAMPAVPPDPSQHAVEKWLNSMNLHRASAGWRDADLPQFAACSGTENENHLTVKCAVTQFAKETL